MYNVNNVNKLHWWEDSLGYREEMRIWRGGGGRKTLHQLLGMASVGDMEVGREGGREGGGWGR